MVLEWVGDDSERGRWVAELCRPYRAHDERLDDICRGLLIRFGASGAPARILMDDVLWSPDRQSSTLRFIAPKLLERVRHWQADPEPAVAAWATALAERLEHLAAEQPVRRHTG